MPQNAQRVMLTEEMVKQLDRLEAEIIWLLRSRSIYRDFSTIIEENSAINKPNPFSQWICWNYGYSTVMGVRRLLDEHKNSKYESLSLPKFIKRLPDNAVVKGLVKEVDALIQRADRVLQFADQGVAHHDLDRPDCTLVMSDIHKVVDEIVELFEKRLHPVLPDDRYYKRKEAAMIRRRSWDQVLRVPWIVPKE